MRHGDAVINERDFNQSNTGIYIYTYIQWCAPPRSTYNHHYNVQDCRSSSVLLITAPNHPQPFLKSVAQPLTADKISIGPMRSSSCCGVATKAVTNQMHGGLSIPAFQEPWHDRRNGHTYPKTAMIRRTHASLAQILGEISWWWPNLTKVAYCTDMYRLYPFATL